MALTLILKILAVIQCQLVNVATVTPIDTIFKVVFMDASLHKLQLIINNIVPSFIITFDPKHLSSGAGVTGAGVIGAEVTCVGVTGAGVTGAGVTGAGATGASAVGKGVVGAGETGAVLLQ